MKGQEVSLAGFDFTYIATGSTLHRQAVKLRYRVFFQPLGVPAGNTCDSLEEKSLHLAAVRDGRLVGYGRLTVGGDGAQVSQLVVEPGFQKRGLGAEILRRLVQRAGDSGIPVVFLNARTVYVPFYARFGFLPKGTVFPSPKTGLPHQRMERPLP